MNSEKYTTVCKKDGVECEITKNTHGYFCDSWNGIKWPYADRAQCAAPTESAAIAACLEAIQECEG